MNITFPTSPTLGQQFTHNNRTYEWDGEKWINRTLDGAVILSDSKPTFAQEGDIWYDTMTATNYVYYNDGITKNWIDMDSDFRKQIEGGSTTKIEFPVDPSVDDTFTFNEKTFQWDGDKWFNATVSPKPTLVSDTIPENPSIGQLWVDTTNNETYVYTDSFDYSKDWTMSLDFLQGIGPKNIAAMASNNGKIAYVTDEYLPNFGFENGIIYIQDLKTPTLDRTIIDSIVFERDSVENDVQYYDWVGFRGVSSIEFTDYGSKIVYVRYGYEKLDYSDNSLTYGDLVLIRSIKKDDSEIEKGIFIEVDPYSTSTRISANNHYIVISSPYVSGDSVYIYSTANSNWYDPYALMKTIPTPSNASSNFGKGVKINENNIIVVTDSGANKTFVYSLESQPFDNDVNLNLLYEIDEQSSDFFVNEKYIILGDDNNSEVKVFDINNGQILKTFDISNISYSSQEERINANDEILVLNVVLDGFAIYDFKTTEFIETIPFSSDFENELQDNNLMDINVPLTRKTILTKNNDFLFSRSINDSSFNVFYINVEKLKISPVWKKIT